MSQIDARFLKVLDTYFATGNQNRLTLAASVITALGKAHTQNADTKLADGTSDEVTAAAIRAFIDSKGQNSGLASLDSGGKIPSSQLPAIAITSVTVVADITERNALTAQEGDVAVVTDSGDGSSKSYIKNASNSWIELKSPAGAVSSVNGQTGTVVLDGGDIALVAPSGWTASDVQAFYDAAAAAIGAAQADATQALSDASAAQSTANDAQTDATAALARQNFHREAPITLNSTEINNKAVTLSQTPSAQNLVRLSVGGGALQLAGTDFSVTGTTLSWDGLGLDGPLAAGDVLLIDYIRS